MKYVPVHIGTYMRCKRVERVNLSEKVENGENGERGEKCKRVERGEKSERWRRERGPTCLFVPTHQMSHVVGATRNSARL